MTPSLLAPPEATACYISEAAAKPKHLPARWPVRRDHWCFWWTSGLAAASRKKTPVLSGRTLVQRLEVEPPAQPLFFPSRQARQLIPLADSVLLRVLFTPARIAKSVTVVTSRTRYITRLLASSAEYGGES